MYKTVEKSEQNSVQSSVPEQVKPKIKLPKLGGAFFILGGGLLFSSLFLPAVKITKSGELIYPIYIYSYNIPGDPFGIFLVKVTIPIFFLFGLTTAVLGFYGSFTEKGISRLIIAVHLLELLLLLVGTGIFFLSVLVSFNQITFGLFLSSFGSLVWLSLSASFIFSLFEREHFKRIYKLTQNGALLTLLVLLIVILDTYYYKSRRIHYGLLISMLGTLGTLLGTIVLKKNERKIT